MGSNVFMHRLVMTVNVGRGGCWQSPPSEQQMVQQEHSISGSGAPQSACSWGAAPLLRGGPPLLASVRLSTSQKKSMLPVRSFLDTENQSSLSSLSSSSSGTVPLSLLSPRSRYIRSVARPKSFGRVPVSSFDARPSIHSLLMSPNSDGIVPSNRFPWRVSMYNWGFRRTNSEGNGPENRFSPTWKARSVLPLPSPPPVRHLPNQSRWEQSTKLDDGPSFTVPLRSINPEMLLLLLLLLLFPLFAFNSDLRCSCASSSSFFSSG
mmetsp:Transcript_6058/g.17702  ORF Transcript_6058/g.17702 Transcript_6058/m.17702 type:complete len:264 (+) Transcript_6058:561-1352(+)